MEKFVAGVLLLGVLLFGCLNSGSQLSPSAQPSVSAQATGKVVEVTITGTTSGGTSWEWTPNVVTVNKGDTTHG